MAEKQTHQTKAKESKRQLAETQKIFDITRVREYDIQEMLTYDLIDTSYLFDAEGLMVKPNKSDLYNELEKMLEPTDYLQTISMDTCQYHCNCRCHGSLALYAIG